MIVGVGGSAGSLTPLRELFGALPADSRMAFVVVSHQAPTGQSLLPEILARTTAMTVCEIAGDTRVRPNHVYVVPRGHSVTVHDGTLSIEPMPEPGRVPMPIDFFFGALARDRGHRAVGIIHSGTGSDGTLGLAAIRAEAGLCLAQDPETAEFEGMPASAVAAQATDYALPIGDMPERLIAYARAVEGQDQGGEPAQGASGEMDRILSVIRLRGGHDFSAYKRGTIMRRIERRMGLHGIERLVDYASYLEAHEEEIDALWRDWLIGVSSFFRDSEAWKALAERGLPALLAARTEEGGLRAWVPACATGEEAYSIATLLVEASRASGRQPDIHVFATDLDPSSIETARIGRYPKAIAEGVGAERLGRFFVEEPNGYRVKKRLRDHIVFAVQDVLRDPPFSRVDVISCRNLLIYLVPSAQQALLSIFHYSLNPGGLLLLGASEHVGASSELFSALDKRWKLFQRNDSVLARPPAGWTPRAVTRGLTAPLLRGGIGGDVGEMLRRRLAERFGPPAVVVDLRGQIQQTHGRVGAFLELPPGRVNLNVLDMARVGLRVPLAAALREVGKDGTTRVEKDVRPRT
ncbi:MAG TPA: chemotaxis protein CheB, partial [Longimicrobiales bacterium]|nr:chemotaxis protein CheB [Longimicrobiales bacterium]